MGQPDPALTQPDPCPVPLKFGRTYFWSACGRSQRRPFCDGSHAGTAYSAIAPAHWSAGLATPIPQPHKSSPCKSPPPSP